MNFAGYAASNKGVVTNYGLTRTPGAADIEYSALYVWHYRGADKSLARPGRKQATATKLARRLTCFLSAPVTRLAIRHMN